MNFNTVDLFDELQKIQKKNSSKEIIEEVNDLLKKEEQQEERINEALQNASKEIILDESNLDASKIYTIEQIQKLCVKYRLRFLDSKYFKGEIPYEAISKVKEIEKLSNQKIESFKIIAPKELFKLEDKDSDPILMIPLKNNRFYFVHKWGGEINVFRSLLAFPMRNFMSMFWFLAVVAVLFAMAIPTESIDVFLFLAVHSFIAICGMACMIVMSLRENFSSTEWDSRYLS